MLVRAPESRVVARRREVVALNEVARVVKHRRDLVIEAVDQPRRERLVGKMTNELIDSGVDEVDARRLERLEEARRESDADAVLNPRATIAADSETHLVQL